MDLITDNLNLLKALLILMPGYISYRIYNIDRSFKKLSNIQTIFGSLIFSLFCYLIASFIVNLFKVTEFHIFASTTFALSVILGVFWKKYGHITFHKVLYKIRVSNEDNLFSCWEAIFGNPKAVCSQVTIALKSGRAFMNDNVEQTRIEKFQRIGVYPYYTDDNGDIYIVATHVRQTPEGEWEKYEDVYLEHPWGLQITYIPKENIDYVRSRLEKSG